MFEEKRQRDKRYIQMQVEKVESVTTDAWYFEISYYICK